MEPLFREYYKTEPFGRVKKRGDKKTEKNQRVSRKENSKKVHRSVIRKSRSRNFPCVSYPPSLVPHSLEQLGTVYDKSYSELIMSNSDPFSLRPETLEQKSEDSTPDASIRSEKAPAGEPVYQPTAELPPPPAIRPFPMDPRFYMALPHPGSPGTPFFTGGNVTDFLDRYLLMCRDYRLAEDQIIPRLPWYCENLIGQNVKSMIEFTSGDWDNLAKAMRKEYRHNDTSQQVNSRAFLEALKNKPRMEEDDIPLYCRRFVAICKQLPGGQRLDNFTQCSWFVQGLPEKLCSELFMRYDIDLEGDEPLMLDTLVQYTITLATSSQRLRDLVRGDKEQDKISALVDDYGRAASKQKASPPSSSLTQAPIAPPVIDTRAIMNSAIEEITHGVKDMMLSTVTAVTSNIQSNVMQAPLPGPRPYRPYQPPPLQQNFQSAPTVVPEQTTSQPSNAQPSSSLIPPQAQTNSAGGNYSASNPQRCNYCWSTDHRGRWQCSDYRADLSSNRIHLNFEGQICVGPPNPGARPVQMRLDRSQRQCVAESERLRYSAPAATVEANTVRVGELEPDELSSEDESWDDKDFGLCVVERRTDSTKEAIVNAARVNEKPKSTANFHEPVRRILKRKVEKEEKLPTPKNTRFGSWQQVTVEDATEDTDMEEVEEFVTYPNGTPEISSTKKNGTFADNKKKAIADTKETSSEPKVVEIDEAKEKPPRALRLPELTKIDMDDETLMKKVTQIPITMPLSELWSISPRVRELFSKPIKHPKPPTAHVSSLGVSDDAMMGSGQIPKLLYSLSTPKAPVRLEGFLKSVALLDSGAEVNVMTSKLMHQAGLSWRPAPHLGLVSHTGHRKHFDGVCENVEINIGGLKSFQQVFVVDSADHQLVLGAPFLFMVELQYEYRPQGAFAVIKNCTGHKSVVFRAIDY